MQKNESENVYLVKDPVCGMKIEPEYAADVDFYKGKIFYFCAHSCFKEFKDNPEKYFNVLRKDDTDGQSTKKYS